MKRLFAVVLALCLFALCACGTPVTATPTDAPTAEIPSAEDPDLSALLTEIHGRVHPGTAGASLTARQLAAQVLDWAASTELTDEQIQETVAAYLAPMNNPERMDFSLQMAAVSGAVTQLRTEDAAALMDDIGGTEGTLFPWETVQSEKLSLLFSASGVEEPITRPNP